MRAKHLHLLLSYSSSFSGSECGRPGAPGGVVTLAVIPCPRGVDGGDGDGDGSSLVGAVVGVVNIVVGEAMEEFVRMTPKKTLTNLVAEKRRDLAILWLRGAETSPHTLVAERSRVPQRLEFTPKRKNDLRVGCAVTALRPHPLNQSCASGASGDAHSPPFRRRVPPDHHPRDVSLNGLNITVNRCADKVKFDLAFRFVAEAAPLSQFAMLLIVHVAWHSW